MSQSDFHDLLRVLLNSKAQSTAAIGDHASATTIREGKIVGFSESQGRGRAATGDIESSNLVSIKISGKAPRGEEGTLKACRLLIEKLNLAGQSWASPEEVSGVQHIDAEAKGENDLQDQTLTIQVVRALTDQTFWQSLGHAGNSEISLSVAEATDAIKAAIALKASKIPEALRPKLTLLLDACDVPGLALDPVIDDFRLRHQDWVNSVGFHSVWIAGPWHEMVNELSSPNA